MTDNKFWRSVSNFVWGEDQEYKDNSYSRHYVHKTWHDSHNTEQDRKRADMHRAEMERIQRERAQKKQEKQQNKK